MYKGHLPFYTVSEMFRNWKKKKTLKNSLTKFWYKCLFHSGLVSLQIRLSSSRLVDLHKTAIKNHNLPKNYPPSIFLSRNLFGTSSRELVNQWVNLRIKSLISDPKLQNEEEKKEHII